MYCLPFDGCVRVLDLEKGIFVFNDPHLLMDCARLNRDFRALADCFFFVGMTLDG